MSADIIFRSALYLGSFLFDAGGSLSRSEFVRSKLRSMKSYSCYKPITLCISISGVKVCDQSGQTVFMAHALRRISYATCDPASCNFAFLAREANADAPDQYCHIFATESPVKAEELNRIMGDAFKLAFARQRLRQSLLRTDAPTAAEDDLTPAAVPALSSLHSPHVDTTPESNEAGDADVEEDYDEEDLGYDVSEDGRGGAPQRHYNKPQMPTASCSLNLPPPPSSTPPPLLPTVSDSACVVDSGFCPTSNTGLATPPSDDHEAVDAPAEATAVDCVSPEEEDESRLHPYRLSTVPTATGDAELQEKFRRISTSHTSELMCHRRRLLSGSPSIPSESSDDAVPQSPQVPLQGSQTPQLQTDEKVDGGGGGGSRWPRLRGAAKSGQSCRQKAALAANSRSASSVSTPSAGDLTSPLASNASFDLAAFTNISPVVAIKNHLDALAHQQQQSAAAAAAERTSGAGGNGAGGGGGGASGGSGGSEEHSRFRLRARNKKKLGVMDRPLSQIIGLDSAALMRDLAALMGSSVQPRSEERLCADPPADSDSAPTGCDKALEDQQAPARRTSLRRTDVQQTASAVANTCSETDLQGLPDTSKDDTVVSAAAAAVVVASTTPSFAPRLADVCPVPHPPSVASDLIVLPVEEEGEDAVAAERGQFGWSTAKVADGLMMHHNSSPNFQSAEGNAAGHSANDRWRPSQNSAFRNIGNNNHSHQQPRPQPPHYPLHAFLDCDGDAAPAIVAAGTYTPDYAPDRVRSISDTRSSQSHGFLSAFNDTAAPRKYSADLPISPSANGWPIPRPVCDSVQSPSPLSRTRQSAFVYSHNDECRTSGRRKCATSAAAAAAQAESLARSAATASSLARKPLQIVPESSVWSHGGGVTPLTPASQHRSCILACTGPPSSTFTTDTPTPTATPTPTPTPTPFSGQRVHSLYSRNGGLSCASTEFDDGAATTDRTIHSPRNPPEVRAYRSREAALKSLAHEEAGSFLVRDSVTHPGCWALSVRVPEHVNCMGITHYLIQHSKHGVKLKGLDKEWPSLEALITHLTVMPEMLPCPLRLPSTSAGTGTPTFLRHQEDHSQSSMRLSGANRTTVPSASPCPRSTSGWQTSANSGHGAAAASSKYRSMVLATTEDFSVAAGATSFSSAFSELDANMHSLRLDASAGKGIDPSMLLSEEDIGEEYQRLSDFSSMLADMRPVVAHR